jgi:glycosyltransferase involved in cell wall biosynthesis
MSNVVNDFSTDGTYGILQEEIEGSERIRVLYHERNRGDGVALRKKTARSTGDTVSFHNAHPEYNT